MSPRRAWRVARLDLLLSLRRPLFWIWILILGLTTWGLSGGNVRIGSGDSSVGGTKAWITSEFANGQLLSLLVPIFYGFFIAVVAGMAVIRDEELSVGALLHSTPLRASEYVWGKFLAALVAFACVLGVHLALSMLFNHVVAGAAAEDYVGPFVLGNYLRPALFLALPTIVFLAGVSFAAGELFRKPILVFFLPVAVLLVCAFFLWNWSPSWLDPEVNRWLMWSDPSGFRWLNETWLKVDRGVDVYNQDRIGFDAPFLLSRLVMIALGLLAVLGAQLHFAVGVRGGHARTGRAAPGERVGVDTALARVGRAAPAALGALSMTASPPGLLAGARNVARAELRELRRQPGLYLFVPLIVMQTVGNAALAVGAFDTPSLVTPGTMAVGSAGVLVTLLCLLLMFYTVESLRREESTRLSSIYYATPVATGSILLGKTLANSLVGVAVMVATFLACQVVLLVQGTVPLQVWPFVLVWGVLLLPTFLLWCAFTAAVYSFSRSRYTAYAVCLGALMLTGYTLVVGSASWVTNWPLWGVLRWSDMGTFELGRGALVMNRLLALAGALFFTALTVRVFPRREADPTRVLSRLRPKAMLRGALRLAAFAALPAGLAIALQVQVDRGFQGDSLEKARKEYWRKNVATWTDSLTPDIAAADVQLELDPDRRWFRSLGTFELVNRNDETLPQVPVTANPAWERVEWTMNGEPYEPEFRSHLHVFTPPAPLAPGEGFTLGFEVEGTYPKGVTKNGGGAGQFILPSGVVLTSFGPEVWPVIGYLEGMGVDEDNSYDAREYGDDFHVGVTRAAFGAERPFPVRTRVTAPERYTINAVGRLVSDEVADGKRTVQWESDHPVNFLNVVAGEWAVREGEGTAIYYWPAHAYNIDEMIEALDGARRFYSEWFRPFPWERLKLSEFSALAGYAQGFATNITFSEQIGFLTKSDPRANAAFLVTAHEAAHQWWGNLLMPGEGPGGNVLSEGMAHYSTILLFEQMKGERQRIEFCRRLEESYGDSRQQDSERSLAKTDGSRAGDTTVTYDKGGWATWMLHQLMGRENMLAGLQSFIAFYETDRDHPVIQDFVAHLRPFAPDPEAFDALCAQWYFDVVVPEYRLEEVERTELPGGGWEVRLRVTNAGTGRMPLTVAAERGARFPDEEDSAEAEPFFAARTEVMLGAGEQAEVVLECPFEPERVLVDPDALVLQLNREKARFDF